MTLFVTQDLDDHVLRGPVRAVAGLDDPVVVLDRPRLSLDHPADHGRDVRRVGCSECCSARSPAEALFPPETQGRARRRTPSQTRAVLDGLCDA